VKLTHLEAMNALRREHAAAYRQALEEAALAGILRLLEENDASPCVYHVFPVLVRDRDVLAGRLAAEGIQTGLHYTPVISGHPALSDCVRQPEPIPVAEQWAAQELSLPMFPELLPVERERVVDACLRAATPAPVSRWVASS
jgi:dTDP-4-amino-4,6-dideoxygalactose transaminase